MNYESQPGPRVATETRTGKKANGLHRRPQAALGGLTPEEFTRGFGAPAPR